MKKMTIVSQTIYSLDELSALTVMQKKYSPVSFIGKDLIPVHEIDSPDELPGEVFRKGEAFVGKKDQKTAFTIEGSNLGRIRLNGKILPQHNSKPDYAYLIFYKKINGNIVSVPVHRVIATLWCYIPPNVDITELEVHHISNNGYDNRPSNLIFVNSTDHKKIHHFS